MITSVQTIPHFYLDLLVDATELRKIREILLGYIEQQAGVRLTYTDLLLKALAVSLVKHPEFNTYWAPEGIKHRDHISIGFAVQTDDRLYVPVVRDADKLSLADLAKARNELVTRARAGKLHLSDLGDASCTLSNLGAYGIDHFHAIINPPESAILAAGRIAARPTVVGESVVARQTIYLSLAVDHRLIDGAAAASFLTAVAGVVESPQNLLLD
jgi:pyruvate dehydrogenase E2 component (dihydrolipoamide acetyltransferase)